MRASILLQLLALLLVAHVLFLIWIYFATQHRLNRPIISANEKLETQEAGNSAYYFAYGANMSRKYLANIRNIHVLNAKSATLHGYALTFNLKGRNFIEPGFANILPSKSESVEGVLYKVTKQDLERILKSEPSEYKITDVEVMVDGHLVAAKTLLYIGEPTIIHQPSKRYLALLTSAAKENGLSEEYIHKLNSTKYAYYPILSEGYGAIIYFYLMNVTSRK